MCEFKKRLAGIFDRSEALPGEAQMLFEHAGGCLECGGLFNLLADADRALAQLAGAGAEVITPFEAVFLDFDSVRKRMEAREAEARGKRRFVIGYAAAAAMAFVSILAFAAYYFIADDGFRERGFMVKPHSEIFCVDAFPDGRREILDPLSLFRDKVKCGIDGELLIAYLNPYGEYREFHAFAVSEEGRVIWYYPNPVQKYPMPLERSERLKPFKTTTKLAVNHKAGRYKFFTFFCGEALEFKEFSAVVKGSADNIYEREKFSIGGDCHGEMKNLEITEVGR